jgi:hypothetical protein
MLRIEADFAPPFQLPKPVLWLLSVGVVASAALWGAAYAQRASAEAELKRVEAAISQAKERANGLAEAHEQARWIAIPFEASARAWTIERRAPLAAAMRVLERVEVTGVVLRSFEFNAQQSLFRVTVVAPGHESVVRFIQALNEGVPATEPGVLLWRMVQSVAESDSSRVLGVIEGFIR